jgi:drug/metabolite transporter (DMT)-like permease
MQISLRAWLLIIALSLVWGGSFFFVEIALEDLPPFTVVLCRVGLAALALLAVIRLSGQAMPRDRKVWRAFLIMGGLNNFIPFSLIVWGQVHIESGLASILNATTPLFTVLLAHLVTADEKMTARRALGVLLGFAGVAVLIGPGALGGLGSSGVTLILAQVAILGAAASYATASLYGRRFRAMPPLVPAAGMLCGSTILVLPVALLVDRPWILSPDPVSMGAVLGLALLSTALAYVLYFRILTLAGSTNLMLVTFLIPVSAILLGTLFLSERLEPAALAGMALIFAGLAAVDGRVFAWLRTVRA